MVEWHMKSNRKTTGGRSRTVRRSTKKLAWRGGLFSETKLAEENEIVAVKGRGNSEKKQLRYVLYANLTDPSTKKNSKVKILQVLENNANRQYARRNIITKGAVIEVDLNGLKHAKVTSRPGQSGTVNAIIIDNIEDKKKTKKRKKRIEPKKGKKTKKEAPKEDKKQEKKEAQKKETKKEEKEKIEDKKEETKENKEEEK